MNKRIFSPRLYFEGIKQLRIIGILSTIAFCLISTVNPIMQYLNSLGYAWDETPQTINYFDMNAPIFLLFCGIAPLMTLYLFSFLNKRDSSDFYHAVPETRQCLFLSFFAAIITWLTFIAVVSAAVITFTYSLFPHLYTVNINSVFITGFAALSGSYLIAASVAIAMCVTGTTFSNVLVSLLLIFLPRTLIQIAIMSVTDALPLVNGVSFAAFLNYEYNVPVGFVFGLLFGDYVKPLSSWSSGIYTFIIAVLFTVVALVLFVKRGSESAGRSAPNKWLQSIYRFLIGSVLTAVAVFQLFDNVVRGDTPDAATVGSLIILFLASVLFALVFQIITSRSFRGLPRYALGMVVSLLLFGGVYFGSIYTLYHTTVSFSPSTENIDSVRILSEDHKYNPTNYFAAKVEEMELTDEQARRIVSEQLAYSIDLLNQSQQRYWQSELPSVPVAIQCNGITHQRKILISNEQLMDIYETVYDTEAFRKIYMDLPETVSYIYVSGRGHIESSTDLYQVLLQEVNEIGFDKWFALQNNVKTDDTEYYLKHGVDLEISQTPIVAQIICQFSEGMKWYEISVPLDLSVLPKTTQEFLKQNKRSQLQSVSLTAALKAGKFDTDDSLHIQFFNFDEATPFGSFVINEELRVNAEAIADWAATLPTGQVPDVTKPFYFIAFEDVKVVHSDNGKEYWHEFDEYWCYYQGDVLPDWLFDLYQESIREANEMTK